MAYTKKEVWGAIIKGCNIYHKYSNIKRKTLRKSNGLQGSGGVEDGCIAFVAFEIVESLDDLRLVFGHNYWTKRKSIIMHSWKLAGNGVKADIDFIFDNGGQNYKHKIKVERQKQEVWFKMIRWVGKTRSRPLGRQILHKSRAMVLTEQKKDDLGFLTPHYRVFYPS
jgi:hypothetical protein